MSSASRSGGVACGIQPSPTVRDPAQRGLARAADPDRRVRLLHRTRPLADVGVLPARPSCGAHSSVQRAEDRVDRLVGDRAPLRERDAERVELALHVAGADAEEQPPVRERVDRRERLRGLERMPVRGDVHVGHQPRALRVRGEERERRDRDRTTWSTSPRPARAGSRRDGTRRRRGSPPRRTPARRAPCRRRCRSRAPTASHPCRERLDRELDPVGEHAVGDDRDGLGHRRSPISPARRPTAARCTRAGRTRRRRGRRRSSCCRRTARCDCAASC